MVFHNSRGYLALLLIPLPVLLIRFGLRVLRRLDSKLIFIVLFINVAARVPKLLI